MCGWVNVNEQRHKDTQLKGIGLHLQILLTVPPAIVNTIEINYENSGKEPTNMHFR